MCTYETIYFYSERRRVQLSKKLDTGKLINQALEQLADKGRVKGRTSNKMFQQAYQPLKEAVNEGYNAAGIKAEFGTPNYEFLKQLQYNVATFAAFKNHAQIKEMAALLVDENGKRRSKEEFRKKALEVDENYNVRYLDVQYDTAVRQARSAAQWQKALTTKHLFPNIKYLPSVSANRREEHQTYYNIIRPIDDPIWSLILPVNAWGCKCGWEVTDEAVTDIPDNLEAPAKGFEFNPGKTGEIFKLDSTEYAKAVPKATKEELIKHTKSVVDFEMAADLPYINVYDSKNGTDVYAHPVSFYQSDFQENLTNARKVANAKIIKADKIEILPILETTQTQQKALRSKLLPNVKGGHNPDYRIDGTYYDLKVPSEEKAGKSTIKTAISKAHDQADGIVLVIDKEDYISENDLYRQMYQKFMHEDYEGFTMVIYYNGQWHTFNRESFLKLYKK
jgi:hypothetical protein